VWMQGLWLQEGGVAQEVWMQGLWLQEGLVVNGVGGRLTFVRPGVLRGTTSPIEGAVGTGKWLWWLAMALAMCARSA
jgi:hypothetical protein